MLGNNDWIPLAVPKKKHTLLPLLIVVFLASYGLMTLLIVEQGEAIQQQRNLIQLLQADSRELWANKGKALTAQAEAQSRAQSSATNPSTQGQAPSMQAPSTQAPTHTPSTQAPMTRTPSTQVPQRRHPQSRAGKGAKPDTQVPPMPASDLGDQRRVLITL